MLAFVIAGIASGSIFALAGVGLVLTYKTSGLFNFAHGAVAAAGAYVFYFLHVEHGLPWPVAAVLSVGVAAPLFGLLLERLAAALSPLGVVPQVMGTIGLLLGIEGLAGSLFGTSVRTFPEFLPTSTFGVLNLRVGWDQLIITVFATATVAALYRYLRLSRSGVAMRAVVDDAALLELAGIEAQSVRRRAWIVGSIVAAASGVLIAPELGLDATLLTLLVVQAFGAAAIGRFDGLMLTYLGGLVIGIAGSVATRYAASASFLSGIPSSVPFLVLFIALVAYPPRSSRAPTKTSIAAGIQRKLPVRTQLLIGGIGAASLLAVPAFVGTNLSVYTRAVIFAVIFMSLGLLVWTSGQVSLCHAAFVALGASTFSHLTAGWHLPWLVALLLTGAVAVPVSVVIAIPASKLSGIYLALATMGFSLVMQYLFFSTNLMFGMAGGRPVPRPVFGSGPVGDVGYYYVALAVLAVTTIVVATIQRTRLGRVFRALADSPSALASLGNDTRIPLLLAFCLSGFLAAVAGGLLGSASGTISSTGLTVFDSLTWLVILALVARSPIPAAFLASFGFVVAPRYLPAGFAAHQTLLFGGFAIFAAMRMGRPRVQEGRWLSTASTAAEARTRHSPIRARAARVT